MNRVVKILTPVLICSLLVAVPSLWAAWIEDGIPVCIESGAQLAPDITSDGAGGAIIVWMNNSDQNLYAQRIDASGTVMWTTGGVPVCTAAGWMESSPRITSDGAGGAIVTWADDRGADSDIYAQRINTSGAIQWAADGVPLCTATDDQYWPVLISDGAGGAIVTWEDQRSGSGNYDIYIQRVNAAGTVQWTTDGVPLCTVAEWQRFPDITSDGAGGAIVTWEDRRKVNPELDINVYAQRVNAAGAVQWTTDGEQICTAAESQGFPMITSDGAGGAFVAWEDERSGNYDIYVQRVNTAGTEQWTTDGIPICTAAADQAWPELTSDGAGGTIVTWKDYRSGVSVIYAQRINAAGSTLWTADGTPLSGNSGATRHMLVSDGASGAIVAWVDYRNIATNPDIYAQHIDASGMVQWEADGAPICTAEEYQWYQRIASDGAGGAIIAWEDTRNGDFWTIDIYAQQTTYVITDAETPETPHAAYLEQNFPNPFNPQTTIRFGLDEAGPVTLRIYDPAGRLVATILDETIPAGHYSETWDGKDANGSAVSSGVYFYKLDTGSNIQTRKMILLR